MELISGESIRAIPINTLIVNASQEDRTQIIEAIHWLMDHIKISYNVHSIFREVDELNYITTNEIYIPAYVINTHTELKEWVAEYKKISPETNDCVMPVIIYNSSLFNQKECMQLIKQTQFGIYIEKSSPFLCCFSSSYKRRKINDDFMTQIMSCIEQFRNQEAVIQIPTLMHESQKDPDYVRMLKNVKGFEEEKVNSPRQSYHYKQEDTDDSEPSRSHFGTVRLVPRV